MLKKYIEKERFKGWDPYDGLNSKFFQSSFLSNWDLAKLLWIQLFKRNPINLRPLVQISKSYNPKALGLLLTGYCNIYNIAKKTDSFGSSNRIKKLIVLLADSLCSISNESFSGACWGYNFDWQARRLFLFKKNTPNVVVTSFCSMALMDAYDVTGNEKYLTVALSSSKFVLSDLQRTEIADGFLFSYSPINGNNTVLNASLMGTKILSRSYFYTKNRRYKDLAKITAKSVVDLQSDDGSWPYGLLPVQSWIDSFHTGYNLESLILYKFFCSDNSFDTNIYRGFNYYIKNFFTNEGIPKYYHNKTYPIDIHSAGQLFVTAEVAKKNTLHKNLIDKVLDWTIKNMQDKEGYFYYQRSKYFTIKIPYMRWSSAFMFYSLSFFLKVEYR